MAHARASCAMEAVERPDSLRPDTELTAARKTNLSDDIVHEDIARSFLPFLPRRALKHWELFRTRPSKSPWAESTLGSLFAAFFSIFLRTPSKPRDKFSTVVDLKASILLLDVSGFTRLSQLYGSRGTAGCEDFSLLISKFFHKVSDILDAYGGDIDCFAGDAVLVVFSPLDDGAGGDVRECTRRAVECAQVAIAELSDFQCVPEDPPLQIHCGIVAGDVWSAICAGAMTSRCEAFLVGPPMQEVGVALGHAEMKELVLGPSAVAALGGDVEGEPRPDGCIAISCRPLAAGSESPEHDPSVKDSLVSFDASFEEIVSMAKQTSQSIMRNRANSDGGSISSILNGNLMERLDVQRGSATGDYARPGAVAPAPGRYLPSRRVSPENQTMGLLDTLPTFTPVFVRQSVLANSSSSSDLMTEHRSVSVLFIVGTIKGVTPDHAWVTDLAAKLGNAMDVAEGQCGGCTRQITMDDKGVALIFVFGLAGFLKTNHPGSCAESAGKVLDVLDVKGITFSAGLTTGSVFCGLVGNPESRCEYAMMGDMVNTAARLAGYGLKNGVRVVCTDEYKKELARYQEGASVRLEEIGTTKLKGKEKEVTVCRVSQVRRVISMRRLRAKSEQAPTLLHGRASDIESMVKDVRSLAAAGCGMVLVKAGTGVGKSAVLHFLAKELAASRNQNDDSDERDDLSALVLEFQLDHGHMNIPMGACHDVLTGVLQRKGHMKDGTALGNLEDIAELPLILKKFSKKIELMIELPRGPARAQSLQQLYVEMISSVLSSGDDPTVLIIDNLHYADPSSLSALQQLSSIRDGQGATKRANPRAARTSLFLLGETATSKVQPQQTMKRRGLNFMSQRDVTEPQAKPSRVVVVGSLLDDGSQKHSWSEDMATLLGEHGSSGPLYDLQPLSADDIKLMAQGLLGCRGLTEELGTMISDFAQGLPANAQQIVWWLREEGMVNIADMDASGMLGLRAGRTATSRVPKTLQSMVLLRIDQLPAGLVLVMRVASVLGVSFDTGILRKVIEAQGTQTLGLADQLATLREFQFIAPVDRTITQRHSFVNSASKGGETWQFLQTIYQQALYQALSHGSRHKLHLLTIDTLEKEMELSFHRGNTGWSQDILNLNLLIQISQQRMLSISAAPAQVVLGDVEAACSDLSTVASLLFEAGYIEQGWRYEDEQMQMLEAAAGTGLRVPAQELRSLHLEVIEQAINNLALLSIIGQNAVPENMKSSRQDRLDHAFQRLSQEQEHGKGLAAGRRVTLSNIFRTSPDKTSKARGMDSTFDLKLFRVRHGNSKASRTSAGSNQVVAQVIVSARFSQLFMQWEKSHEVLERHLVVSIHDRLAKEDTLVGIACIAPQLAMCYAGLTRFDLSRDAVQLFHTQYDKQGRPDDFRPFKVLMGILAVPQLANLQHSYEDLIGQIDRPVTVNRKEREITAAMQAACPDYMGLMLSCGSASSYEYMWEPEGSPRHSKRYMIFDFVWEKCVDLLKKSTWKTMVDHSEGVTDQSIAADAILRRLESISKAESSTGGGGGGSMEDVELLGGIHAWGNEMRHLSKIATTKFWKLDAWKTIRMLLETGCRLIWPREADSDSCTLGDLLPPVFTGRELPAARHLLNISECLSGLLVWWEAGFINRNGSSGFPSALIWARSMLHWFQWLLWTGGHREDEPEDVNLKSSVDGWGPGPKVKHGPTAVSRGLLLAIAMAAEDGGTVRTELMTAQLPATISLAVLLIGSQDALDQGLSTSKDGPIHLEREVPPLLVPFRDSSNETQREGFSTLHAPCSSRVYVKPGSVEAKSYAASQLKEVLDRITIQDQPIDIYAAKEPEDVGESVVLWRAVVLFNHCALG